MEVAEDVSSKSVVSRTCRQCPKMFKDLSRAGKAKQEMNATKTRGNAWKKGRHSLQSSSPSRSRHFKCPSARMQGIAQQESIADRVKTSQHLQGQEMHVCRDFSSLSSLMSPTGSPAKGQQRPRGQQVPEESKQEDNMEAALSHLTSTPFTKADTRTSFNMGAARADLPWTEVRNKKCRSNNSASSSSTNRSRSMQEQEQYHQQEQQQYQQE
ncbi:uncharacterized protein [Heterodontus francisci]|uniref:uncharacterized protein isoform X2 n=1 Tax=Heterodontus francisci TaxID=7792 RepID=UPI00355C4793